jgi:hypothetical protein
MSDLGQTETNNLSGKMTASPLKADILLRLGGVSSVPGEDMNAPSHCPTG